VVVVVLVIQQMTNQQLRMAGVEEHSIPEVLPVRGMAQMERAVAVVEPRGQVVKMIMRVMEEME
jgi:hypothetical protein